MAPELLGGAAADQRTDIYALGVLLFHLVTGRYPVTGRSLKEIVEQHQRGIRAHLRDLRPELPGAFVRAVEGAIEVEPSRRFASAGELESALDSAFTRVSPPTVTVGRAVRWPMLAAGMVLIVAVAVALSNLMDDNADGRSPASGERAVATLGLTAGKLTMTPNVWAFTNPSADGRFVVGMHDQGDAAVVDLMTNEVRLLGLLQQSPNGYPSLGVISPDGEWVAIDWHDDKGGWLRIGRTDGTEFRTIKAPPEDTFPFDWSDDGRLIAAVVQRADGSKHIGLIAVADGAVRMLKPIGRDVPEHMSLSRDGRYIAYDYPEHAQTVDRDVWILDAHTGEEWLLAPSPGHDSAPFWTPDGRGVVFLSDRNRSPSLWLVETTQGRPSAPPRLLKDGVGRVWLRGFTDAGALHYDLFKGFAEVYIASLRDSVPQPRSLAPRQALSNFYPVWSRDGRFIAYSSERRGGGRELWTYDAVNGVETRVPHVQALGRPFGWSPDSKRILVAGSPDQTLHVVDRSSGDTQLIATRGIRAAWGEAGIVYLDGRKVVVYDNDRRRAARVVDLSDPAVTSFSVASDGRSVLAAHADGRLTLNELASGRFLEWRDPSAQLLAPNHFLSSDGSAVLYVVFRAGDGDERSLYVWNGTGEPRELLRTRQPERFALAGWSADDANALVIRMTQGEPRQTDTRQETLWRVPIAGGPPASTGLQLEGLRDISFHPDRESIAFNAGWRQSEPWVMENLLPSTRSR
jgi:WD40 repeat protein